MDERAFASATLLAGEIRDRRIGCLELLDFVVEALPKSSARAPSQQRHPRSRTSVLRSRRLCAHEAVVHVRKDAAPHRSVRTAPAARAPLRAVARCVVVAAAARSVFCLTAERDGDESTPATRGDSDTCAPAPESAGCDAARERDGDTRDGSPTRSRTPECFVNWLNNWPTKNELLSISL